MTPFANPYVLLAAAGAALALSAGSFYAGHDWATTKAESERARQAAAYAEQLHEAFAYGNEVAARLAAAEGKIVIKTVEVIKHVPQVTTGRLCLDADAVGLLNPGADWGPVYPSAGQPADQSPSAPTAAGGNAASDRDIAYWIADANRLYETCAARMNALADWHGAAPADSRTSP